MMDEIIGKMHKAEEELILGGTLAIEGEKQAAETRAGAVKLSEAASRANDLGTRALELLTEGYAQLGLFVEAQHDGHEAAGEMRAAAERAGSGFFGVGSCALSAGELIASATGEDEPDAAQLKSLANGAAWSFRDLQSRAGVATSDFSRGERGARSVHSEVGKMLGLLRHLVEETPPLFDADHPGGRSAAQQAVAATARAAKVLPAANDLQAKVIRRRNEWR